MIAQSANLMEALAAKIQGEPDFKKASPVFVSIYNRAQCYGGPEEGGWWYDVYSLQGGKPFATREEAEIWLEAAKQEIERMNEESAPARWRAMASLPDCDNEPLPDSGEGYIPRGWDDGGELEILIEDTLGQLDNTREPRPHYE